MGDQLISNDLKVTIDSVFNVVPARDTPKESLPLSNIDQTCAFPVETVYFYKPRPDKDSTFVCDKIRGALSELLVSYYPLAGRIKFNLQNGRMEVLCNGDGVLLAVGTSKLAIDELGDIGFENPQFRSLVINPIAMVNSPPLVTIQVTRFNCGGFAFGMCTNHAMSDGVGATQFLLNLAALTRGEEMLVMPKFDRTCFKARDPPRIEFPHPELMELPKESTTAFTKREHNLDVQERGPKDIRVQDLTQISNRHVYRSFPFPAHALLKLKARAMQAEPGKPCSTFEAMVAHVWQARVKACTQFDEVRPDNDELTSVLFAVDIRKRVKPALDEGFCGNGVLTAYAQARPDEIRANPLSFCVRKVQEGIERVTSHYILSAIDWLEVHKGIPSMGPHGNFYLSAWWKLPFHKLDFGFGPPIYAGPVMNGVVDMVLLISNCSHDEGLNLLLALPPHEMANFERHIQI